MHSRFSDTQRVGLFSVIPINLHSLIVGIEICLGVPLQSVQLFLPVIIKRLGYNTVLVSQLSSRTITTYQKLTQSIQTNLYTVAPNVSGAVMLLILAFASDLTRLRSPFGKSPQPIYSGIAFQSETSNPNFTHSETNMLTLLRVVSPYHFTQAPRMPQTIRALLAQHSAPWSFQCRPLVPPIMSLVLCC